MSHADGATDGRKAMQALREAVMVGVGAAESLVQLHQHTSCNICYVRQTTTPAAQAREHDGPRSMQARGGAR
jgi:hypothetical protein